MSTEKTGGEEPQGFAFESRRRRVQGRIFATLKAVGGFRGEDGRGPSLGFWAGATVLVWLLALLYAPVEPAVVLFPPMFTLAVTIPAARALARAGGVGRALALIGRVDVPLVALVYAGIGFGVFGAQWHKGMIIDTGDHQFIMARAQVFYEGLRHGHWQHWTHLWQGGDTITDLYPIEANLLTAAVHALAPAHTSFETSYTLTVLLSWWLRGVGVYYLARRFSSPVVSFLLGCAALLDVGSDVWGGTWHAAIYWGMVHNTLALTFGLFATALQVDLTRRVTGGRFAACAVFVALTACGHAIGELVMAISTFALAVALWVGRGSRRKAAWALAATCLGLALAAVWLIPFSRAMAAGSYRVAAPGSTFGELGKQLLRGEVPTSSFAAFTGFALIAALMAAVSGDIAVASAGIASCLLVGLVVTPFLVSARVLHYFPALADSQPVRMLAAFKTVALPCVAWAIASVTKRFPREGSLAVGRVLGRSLLFALIVYGPARTLVSGMTSLGMDLRDQVKRVGRHTERSNTGRDYNEMVDWLAQRRREDPSPTLWRASVLWNTAMRHAIWAEGVNIGVPFVDSNQVATEFFKIRPRERNERGYNDWNIRYVVTDHEGPPFPATVERFHSGRFHVWELEHYDDRYALAPDPVRVTNIALEGESIRFHVEGVPPGGADIQLRTAAFPRWRAREGGQWLPVSARPPRPDAKPHQEQLVVHAAADGDVVMTCDGPLPGYWAGLFVTIAAAFGIALGSRARRRDRLESLLAEASDRVTSTVRRAFDKRQRLLPLMAAASLVGVVALGFMLRARGARQLNGAALEGLGAFEVLWLNDDGHFRHCWPEPWRSQFECGTDVVVDGFVGSTVAGDDSGEFSMLWPGVRVASRQPATILLRFGLVRLSAANGFWIQNSTWNAHHAKVKWGDDELGRVDFSGEEVHKFTVPPGTDGVKPLSIEIKAPLAGSTCTIRGGDGKPPPAP